MRIREPGTRPALSLCHSNGSILTPSLDVRDGVCRNLDLCNAPGAKICRNIDLCKPPGRNLSENGPVRRSRGKNLSENRPVQVTGAESAGISTGASLSVAQVASPTGFSLPRPRGVPSGAQPVVISTCASLSVAQVAFPTGFLRGRSRRRPARTVVATPNGTDALAVATGVHPRLWTSLGSIKTEKRHITKKQRAAWHGYARSFGEHD